MAGSAIIVSFDSSDESVGSPPSRVILFGDIPVVIPSISMVAPETSTTSPIISSAAPMVGTTLVASPTGLCGLVPYSDSDSDLPDEMDSPEHITPLSATSPFLCTDSSEDFDSSDAPPSGSIYDCHCSLEEQVLSEEAVPFGRPYRTRLNGTRSPSLSLAPVHSSRFVASDQAHYRPSTRDVSPILDYPPVRAPRRSEAFRHWCAALLSTFYPPTTSESSSGDSSERPRHLYSLSAGPSRKRCRPPTDFVPSSTPVTGSLAPTRADLLPPRKREEFEASTGDTIVLGIDPRSVPRVDEEIVEPLGGDSSSSSGTRDGTVRIVGIETTQRRLEADQMLASRARASMSESIRSLRSENLKEEFRQIRDDRDDLWRSLRRFQELTMMCTKMVPEEEDRVEKFIGGLPDNIQGNVIAVEPTRLQDAVRIANNLMDKKLKGYTVKNAENKRIFDTNHRDNRGQQPPFKRQNTGGQNVARAYTTGNNEKKVYGGHYQKDYLKVKNQNHGNKERVPDARGKAYVLGGGDTNPGPNTVTGTFLLNDHHAYMLFDSGAYRSFVSNTFSTLLDITPSALDVSYVVELADERTSETNTVLRGCTLGLLRHPFNIDLMPIDLGSFDVFIGMDWLVKNHAVIVCDEKIVRIPYE
nr:hypothetical protein [Tanacetum cinerariifolium]